MVHITEIIYGLRTDTNFIFMCKTKSMKKSFIKFLTSPLQGSANSLRNKRFFNKQREQRHVYSILGDIFISSFDDVSAFVVIIIVMSNLIQRKKRVGQTCNIILP